MFLIRNLLAKALQISRRPNYLTEALRIAVSLDDVKEASAIAKELMTLDVDNVYAALGLVLSLLMSGNAKDAATQYEIVHEAHQFVTSSTIYYVIGAILAKQKSGNFDDFRQQIAKALDVHQNNLQNIPFGVDYLSAMDSDVMYLIAQQILDFAPLVPVKAADDCLKIADKVLTMIVDASPGLAHVTYLLARVQYLSMDYGNAEESVKLCLEKNESFTEAYLLRAQMTIDRGGKINEAEQALTTGLNFNFAVRDTSLYHLIKAKTLKRKNENNEAIQTLRAALKIPQKERSKNLLAPLNEQ
ncbi:unnamed protein product [Caenorhabditis auriculariae]|uniref:Tetratricopeptide repeat protein 21A/21B second ARM domain-containing protein n=1 Tax=Caenorhabditis auriculariae TaxID=2777116 RepID=A0A8S1HPL1_9PELO|nr:unnamed protein product [Caenorhabditis auriculariae]